MTRKFNYHNKDTIRSNSPERMPYNRENTKSKSLANIFALNNRFINDHDAKKMTESVKSGRFSLVLKGSQKNSQFYKNIEEIKSLEDRINLYSSKKETRTSMNTLKVPNAVDSAFPNNASHNLSNGQISSGFDK